MNRVPCVIGGRRAGGNHQETLHSAHHISKIANYKFQDAKQAANNKNLLPRTWQGEKEAVQG